MPRFSGWPPRAVGYAAAAIAAVLAAPAWAQTAPPYETLVERLDDTPAAQEAEALNDAAQARVRQARALPNPEISAEVENVNGQGPYRGFGAAETTYSINQPLELFGQRGSRINAARAEAGAAGLRRDRARIDAAARLALAYAEAEAAARRAEIAEEALSLVTAERRAADALVASGREPALRAIQAESEEAAASARLAEARAERDAAFAYLSAIALLPAPVDAIAASLLEREPPAVGLHDGRDAPGVRLAEAESVASQRLVSVERARGRPDLSASVGVRRFEEIDTEAMTFGVTLRVPLFDRNGGAVAAAEAESRAARARAAAARLEAEASERGLHARRDAATERAVAAERARDAAAEAYRLTLTGYEAGRVSQLELRSTRIALLDAHNALLDARLARVRAEVELARLEGRIPFGEAQ